MSYFIFFINSRSFALLCNLPRVCVINKQSINDILALANDDHKIYLYILCNWGCRPEPLAVAVAIGAGTGVGDGACGPVSRLSAAKCFVL